jgi:hypothetical protein
MESKGLCGLQYEIWVMALTKTRIGYSLAKNIATIVVRNRSQTLTQRYSLMNKQEKQALEFLGITNPACKGIAGTVKKVTRTTLEISFNPEVQPNE